MDFCHAQVFIRLGAVVVDNLAHREIEGLIAPVNPAGKIDILGVHEKALIE